MNNIIILLLIIILIIELGIIYKGMDVKQAFTCQASIKSKSWR